jgi:phosphotransferase system enzyme I (PtsI)
MIKMVVDEGTWAQKPVSVCGEIAADPHFIPLLIGLGVHDLSVSSPSLPVVKNVIRRLSIIEARKLAEHVLTLSTVIEVEEVLEEAYRKLQAG